MQHPDSRSHLHIVGRYEMKTEKPKSDCHSKFDTPLVLHYKSGYFFGQRIRNTLANKT